FVRRNQAWEGRRPNRGLPGSSSDQRTTCRRAPHRTWQGAPPSAKAPPLVPELPRHMPPVPLFRRVLNELHETHRAIAAITAAYKLCIFLLATCLPRHEAPPRDRNVWP